MSFKIEKADTRFIREPLLAPFGFKGKYLTELWQTVVYLETSSFASACPTTVSVLWSDANVFAEHTPEESSALMCSVTKRALELLVHSSVERPDKTINALLPELKKYADKICGREVATTFVLNSLVGVDYCLWSLYAKENNIDRFDGIIPDYARDALSEKHNTLAHIPLVSYAVTEEALKNLLESGTGILKIKIGKSCGENLTFDEDMRSMLEWDKNRLTAIHNIARQYSTDLSKDGKIRYYLDANGRYDTKDRLISLLDHADKIGALEHIELIEEPFTPTDDTFVGDLPVVINADESAHSLSDVDLRLAQGYKAVALKPIAKTMSVSFEMASAVKKAGGRCLCADLTVVPLLAEWNKQFASRIGALSGMKCGCVEINGNMNYKNWAALKNLLPENLSSSDEEGGRFKLDNCFYENGALLFGKNGYIDLFR